MKIAEKGCRGVRGPGASHDKLWRAFKQAYGQFDAALQSGEGHFISVHPSERCQIDVWACGAIGGFHSSLACECIR